MGIPRGLNFLTGDAMVPYTSWILARFPRTKSWLGLAKLFETMRKDRLRDIVADISQKQVKFVLSFFTILFSSYIFIKLKLK